MAANILKWLERQEYTDSVQKCEEEKSLEVTGNWDDNDDDHDNDNHDESNGTAL